MTALLAVLMDSYLALKSQRLFKTVLVLSLLVIVGFASFGFNEQGMSLFFGAVTFENEFITAGTEVSRVLYLGIFTAFIVNIWLAWAATILALISTSSIFPTFISEGSVELVMSKPVRRSTMFLAKYLGGLLFVLLQVGLFCLGMFFVVAWRIGEWNFTIFLAIPLVTIFFSYLFSVNVLVGTFTRSTLIALLATLLFWFSTFGLRTADDALFTIRQLMSSQAAMAEDKLQFAKEELASSQSELESLRQSNGTASAKDFYAGQVRRQQTTIDSLQPDVEGNQTIIGQLVFWGRISSIIRWPLPETSRTIGLLHRWVESGRNVTMQEVMSGRLFDEAQEPLNEHQQHEFFAQQRQLEREQAQSAASIIGWSLGFEAVIMLFAWWIFVRRDY